MNEFLHDSRWVAWFLGETSPANWPLPTYPDFVREAGSRIVESLCDRRAIASPDDANYALDEWLTSDEIHSLSTIQRCVLGCALLEMFCELPNLDRVSPSIRNGIHNIWPVLRDMPREGIDNVRRIVGNLQRCEETIDLDEFELAELEVFAAVLDDLSGNRDSYEVDAIHESLHVALQDYTESAEHWQRSARPAIEAAINCTKLSAELRQIFRKAQSGGSSTETGE